MRRGRRLEPATERRSSADRWLLVACVGSRGMLCLLYYVVTLLQVWSTRAPATEARPVRRDRGDGRRPVRRPAVAAAGRRLDHVVELWPRRLAPMVVVTGGKQPGDRFTEAEASAPTSSTAACRRTAILHENAGHIDVRVARGRRRLARRGGLRQVLLVTDPFHALRSRADRRRARSRGLRVADPTRAS